MAVSAFDTVSPRCYLPHPMPDGLDTRLKWRLGLLALFSLPFLFEPPTSGGDSIEPEVDSGMILYLPLDGEADDSAPSFTNQPQATMVNFPSSPFVPGVVSNALIFSSNAYLEVRGPTLQNLTNGFSLSFFFLGNRAAPAAVLAQGNDLSANRWTFQATADGAVEFQFKDVSSDVQEMLATTNALIGDNLWHHLTAVHHPPSGAALYVDGEVQAAGTIANWNFITTDSITLGSSSNSSLGSGFILDDVHLYQAALSSDRVRRLFEEQVRSSTLTAGEGSGGLIQDSPVAPSLTGLSSNWFRAYGYTLAQPSSGASIETHALATPSGPSERQVMTFRAYIDGSDFVHIQSNTVWYVHRNFQLPGKWPGTNNFPTIINGNDWLPNWATAPVSSKYEGLVPSLPSSGAEADIDFMLDSFGNDNPARGVGTVGVTQAPGPGNNYEAVVLIDDDAPGGPDWYNFTVSWKPVGKVDLTEIWEKDNRCNDLATQNMKDPAYVGLNRLFVSVEANDKAELHIKTILTPSVAGIGSQFVWGVLDGTTLLPESGTLQDDGEADVIFATTGDHKVYTIHVGSDRNGDGKLQQDEIEETPTPPANPFTVLVVTRNDYINLRISLEDDVLIAGFFDQLPTARALLTTFLTGVPPEGANVGAASLFATNLDLTHVAGSTFQYPLCNTTIPHYTFLDGSAVSDRVEKSNTIDAEECKFLLSKEPEVEAFFVSHPDIEEHEFPWEWEQIFEEKSGTSFNDHFDLDLHNAFGAVKWHASVRAVIRKDLKIKSVRTTGGFTDLYDFDYEAGGRNTEGATVQLGFNTRAGNSAGRIFEDEVVIDSNLNKWKDILTKKPKKEKKPK